MVNLEIADRESFDTAMFQNRMFQYLQSKKISNVEFASSIGVSKQHVSKWKNNKTLMNTSTMIKVLSVYNEINLNWLVTGKGPFEMIKDHSRLQLVYNELDKGLTKLNEEIKELKEQRDLSMLMIKRYESERSMLWDFIKEKTGLNPTDIGLIEKDDK